MAKIRISVTQKMIDHSRAIMTDLSSDGAACCPVALAIRARGFKIAGVFINLVIRSETTGDYDVEYVAAKTATNFGSLHNYGVTLPDKARKFIETFDRCQKVEPFHFLLDDPENILQSA